MEDSGVDFQNAPDPNEDVAGEESPEEAAAEKDVSDSGSSKRYTKKCLKIDVPWSDLASIKPVIRERPNDFRFQRPFRRPRLKPKIKRAPRRKKCQGRLPLSRILRVPFLRKNPYISGIMEVDGIPTLPEAAAVTVWSTIETALLILNYLEGKKEEMRSLRLYTCEAVTKFFKGGKDADKCQVEGCPCDKNPLSMPYIPMESSMFYNYQFTVPLYVWPYEKDFNIFVGLRAIDEYIRLRINWMKNINFGIRYDHYEVFDSSVRHIYSITGCNMKPAYPIGQATFNLVFIIIAKCWGSDPLQRVSARFFVEGHPMEFIPMVNDHIFTGGLVRQITNRKIRYFSKFNLTNSLLQKERSTDKQMIYKKNLIKNYKKVLESNATLTSKKTVSIPAYTALCGFCITFNGQCAIHKEKCQWDELFTPEAAAKAHKGVEREQDNTIICPAIDIFWPDVKQPMKTLFGREVLLW